MAAAQWFEWQLPAWLGSAMLWFVVLNIVVGAIAALSARAQPSLPSPCRGGGIRRRASSTAFHRMRSFSWFSIFSYPSSCFNTWPDTAATFQEIEEPGTAKMSPSARRVAPTSAEPAPETEEPALRVGPTAADTEAATEEDSKGDDGEGWMSMEEAYALAVAGRQQPPPTEEEVIKSEVDVKADEFIRGFKDDLRQQRLDSIFNYTQMLKHRAASHRPAVAAPDTNH